MTTWVSGALRIWCLISVTSLLVFGVAAHRGLARTERVLGGLGKHLMQYAHANHQSAPRELVLNGASVFFSVGATKASVSEVLDYFHRACRERGPSLVRAFRDPQISEPARQAVGGDRVLPLLEGVVRFESASGGVVACVDTGGQVLKSGELKRRLQQFLATGDLAAVGDMRYALVERGRTSTVLVTAWTDGPLNVREMFPGKGDAPGVDIPGVPRPAGSRRLLSTFHADGDDMVAMYSAPMTASELHGFYVAALRDQGFSFDETAGDSRNFVVAHRSGAMLSLALTQDGDKGVAVLARQPGPELARIPHRP